MYNGYTEKRQPTQRELLPEKKTILSGQTGDPLKFYPARSAPGLPLKTQWYCPDFYCSFRPDG
jgi:hypothetical protein